MKNGMSALGWVVVLGRVHIGGVEVGWFKVLDGGCESMGMQELCECMGKGFIASLGEEEFGAEWLRSKTTKNCLE